MLNDRRSRRYVLAALPALALTAVACGTTDRAGAPASLAPPRPTTPDDALAVLMDGNVRFASSTPAIRDTAEIERIWSKGIDERQEPFATVLGCSDSRLAPELLFDQFVGDIFVVREAGNIADSPTNLGSLEYGQAVLGSKVLVVLGHSNCGAVKAAYDNATPGGNIGSIVTAIRPGIAGAADLDQAIARNVAAVIERIRKNSPVLTEAEKSGTFKIVGAFYDIGSATVRLL
ncbi:MAG: carbonic anhydrase [Mycobacterium sp.]